MRRCISVLLAAIAALAIVPAAAAGVKITNLDTSGVPSIRLTVITAKPSHQPPHVYENGAPVTDLSAVDLGSDKRIVLAVDHSQSMYGRSLRDAVAAARRFVALGQTGDQFAILTFASTVTLDSGFGSAAQNAGDLNGLTVDAHYGTRLYDAVVQAARILSTAGNAGRVLILVTDGQETTSHHTLQQAIRAARRARVSVYPIAIESTAFSPTPLRLLAARTGGSYHGARSSAELNDIYANLSRELQRTWQLRYLTSARPGDHIRIAATVSGQGSNSRLAHLAAATPTRNGSAPSGWLIAAFAVIAAMALALTMPPAYTALRTHRRAYT
jgi:hypothetical protein